MSISICGLDCLKCPGHDGCKGCSIESGAPSKNGCILADCCIKGEKKCAGKCFEGGCELIAELVDRFNSLGIDDMPKINSLNALIGSYINLEYNLPGGPVKLLDDERYYLGNQVEKIGSDRCYGLAADERYMLVCEYGCGGADPEIVLFKRYK